MKFLALTTCCVDYYPQIQKSFIGGNSLNLAAMWSRMGANADIAMICCLGDDQEGEQVMQYLKNTSINTSRVYQKNGKTAGNQLRVDESGERFGIEGTWEGGVYETFLLSEDDWSFVAEQDLIAMPGNNPNFQEMIRRKKPDQLLSVDYLDIENGLSLKESLIHTDIAFIAAREELLDEYRELSRITGKLIVVTLGAGGSYAFHGERGFFQTALPVERVVDTTGCGDCYQAAFAMSYYQSGDIQKAMYEGALAASKILQDWGGAGKD